jgi:hypothetical protein
MVVTQEHPGNQQSSWLRLSRPSSPSFAAKNVGGRNKSGHGGDVVALGQPDTPGLVPIHVYSGINGVDGRDQPGQGESHHSCRLV